jgi:hypothetical protein
VKGNFLILVVILVAAFAPAQPFTSVKPAPPTSGAARPSPAEDADAPVFIGAGDIGSCPLRNGKYRFKGTMAEVTAELVTSLLPADPRKGVVFVAGDNAYMVGSAQQYAECYDPTWGRFKARTRPVPGNHEYIREGRPRRSWFARDYFDYFGETLAGKRSEGFYSYDLGEWHILALNSELRGKSMLRQEQWVADDLAKNGRPCMLAYWHRPVFTSGEHGVENGEQNPDDLGMDRTMQKLWRRLDEAGVDVVVTGHDHNYERFHPQDADGNADPDGITEFVVGTGGVRLRASAVPPAKRRNSAAFDRFTHGVLKLTLRPESYDYEFIPAASKKRGHKFGDKSETPVPCER